MSNRIAPKLLAEFIGPFLFVFIGAGAAALVGDGVGLVKPQRGATPCKVPRMRWARPALNSPGRCFRYFDRRPPLQGSV
jgi:hypothetical protein